MLIVALEMQKSLLVSMLWTLFHLAEIARRRRWGVGRGRGARGGTEAIHATSETGGLKRAKVHADVGRVWEGGEVLSGDLTKDDHHRENEQTGINRLHVNRHATIVEREDIFLHAALTRPNTLTSSESIWKILLSETRHVMVMLTRRTHHHIAVVRHHHIVIAMQNRDRLHLLVTWSGLLSQTTLKRKGECLDMDPSIVSPFSFSFFLDFRFVRMHLHIKHVWLGILFFDATMMISIGWLLTVGAIVIIFVAWSTCSALLNAMFLYVE
jgi:hypothetical protein